MRRATIAALVAATITSGLALFGARDSQAIELQLPGERRLDIHGFYETRLLFTGEDYPANGGTFSQFRHVLSLETELQIFPDGFGPFDVMFAFTRWLVSYDCIYERACDTSSSADSYGGDHRNLNRVPKNLKQVTTKSPFVAGIPELPQKYVTGTLRSPIEELNPEDRYRNCVNDAGIFSNPFPLSAYCNANNRSPLDAPVRPGSRSLDRIQAGSFNRDLSFQFLNAARNILEKEDPTRFAVLQDRLGSGRRISTANEHLRRGLLREAAIAERTGDTAGAEAKRLAASNLLRDPNNPADPFLFEAAIANFDGANALDGGRSLLSTRPDIDRFAVIADGLAPELRTALWGAGKIGQINIPFLATIDTPIRPQGYFLGTKLDLIGPYEEGLSEDIINASLTGVPAGIKATIARNKAIPFVLGNDGVRNTADDLPFAAPGLVTKSAVFTGTRSPFDNGQFTESAKIDLNGKTLELYGVYKQNQILFDGCNLNSTALNSGSFVLNPATNTCTDTKGVSIDLDTAFTDALTPEQEALRGRLFKFGCQGQSEVFTSKVVGINANGDCIRVNADSSQAADIPFDVLPALADPRFRPEGSQLEPIDLSDLQFYAGSGGRALPARPRAPDGGLYFSTPGNQRLVATSHHLVSRLDLDFTEDELRWNHGASQDENEFAEGYLEFEMLDSQLFARLGKLIVVWGKTELFRNQDRNNPLDIGNGLFQPLEESRTGQWGANITVSPEAWMRVGPVEDMRLELLAIFDDFEPTDLGKCGEGAALGLVCLKSFGAIASGLAGIGLVGEVSPEDEYNGLEKFDYGIRLEGRLNRFTFAFSDFWGWDDGFYIDTIFEYQRLNDATTGAPLAAGGGSCSYRTDPGGTRIGPDGIAGTGDEIFPTSGNCLLWTDPDANGKQTLRDSSEIARLHTVNQTIFHTFCTLTFDADEGFCAFDRLNAPDQFFLVTDLLSGLGLLTDVAIQGVETLRPTAQGNNLQKLGTDVVTGQFIAANPNGQDIPQDQNLSSSLEVEQQALLGCGPAYASPCHAFEREDWADKQDRNFDAVRAALSSDPNVLLGSEQISGGIDLMNADASVVTQEFSFIKAFSGGQLTGTRKGGPSGLVYAAGMNFNRRNVTDGAGNSVKDKYLGVTPDEVIAGNFARFGITETGVAGRAAFARKFESDGWIEPMPFAIKQEPYEKFGAIVFDTQVTRGALDVANTKWNLIDPTLGPDGTGPVGSYENVDGELCEDWFNNPFTTGCTGLERVSANLARFLIPVEILGPDRVFSPAESLEELFNKVSGNYELEGLGDPIAGPDGLFSANSRVFNLDLGFNGRLVKDTTVVQISAPSNQFIMGTAITDPNAADTARTELRTRVDTFDPQTCPTTTCFLEVPDFVAGFATGVRAAAAIPIAFTSTFQTSQVGTATTFFGGVDPNAVVVSTQPSVRVNLLALRNEDATTFSQIFAPETPIAVDNSRLGDGTAIVKVTDPLSPLYNAGIGRPGATCGGVTFPERCRELPFDLGAGTTEVKLTAIQASALIGDQVTQRGPDVDKDGTTDLDRDHDGIWDGADDYTEGPVTDDNIFCGSGVPGDLFQDLPQYTPSFPDEVVGSDAFSSAFPDGLPPRSPVFCRSLVALSGATGQTLRYRRAGGDGSYGRRDFLWHGGRQLAIKYQKLNVFGFGLDFAEDTTKSSWGIEFSWSANKLFPNSIEETGLSESDEMVLSVSVDRPTFFNFLNPNRSFFLNFQFFVRYLTDYEGGGKHKDGMFGTANAPVSTTMVFTFFTGYFQDRLSPRLTLLYDPGAAQGAAIAGLSYRWNESFSTSIGFNHFFGKLVDTESSYFPALQYTSPLAQKGTALRGVTPVINRDNLTLRVRYTF